MSSQVYVVQADVDQLPAARNASVYHGDTWTLTFQLNDNATTPHDLTNATVAASAQSGANVTVALVTSTGIDSTAGTVTVGPPPGDLAPGRYTYDLQLTEDASVLTWARGELTVVGDITTP